MIAPDEAATIAQILTSQKRLQARNRETFGRPVRASHGKIHVHGYPELARLLRDAGGRPNREPRSIADVAA